ncbi:serine protease [Pseudomonas sp. R2-60-08W]|uniref:trypsin-like serine peptidase n=1 Tax=Pseudomonas sp. R2-60-08W TaxID=1173280 RepID=UPI000F58CFA2|nr:trypsin-like peptidase domain-containing protein [Pseudomonas sp. R2-60-08W]AZF26302.1 trypsin domain protein [Pseudomonas sp. R2-60-08W]
MLTRCFIPLLLLVAPFIPGQSHGRDLAQGLTNQGPSAALQNHDQQYGLWSGIGLMKNAIGQSCNAVLLDTRDRQNKAVGPAYVLTSGHCVYFSYGTAAINQAIEANITFNYFHDTPVQHRSFLIKKAHWSSMVGTDLAILELDTSLAALVAKGIVPLKLAAHQQAGEREVINVGSPSGFREKGLRMSACKETATNSFVEHPGVFPGATKNRCQDLQYGSSGSPMLDRRTNEITGIVSKVAAVIKKDILSNCQNTSACEAAKFNYSYPANDLHHCFVDGRFLNNTLNCQLKSVELVLEEPWKLNPYVHLQQGATGLSVRPTWNIRFSILDPFYRFKSVRDVKECRFPNGYYSAVASAEGYINQEIGPALGPHVLCIIGIQSRSEPLTPALLHNVFTHAVFLTAPTPAPQISLNYNVNWDDQHTDFTQHYFYVDTSQGALCQDIDDVRYAFANGSATYEISQLPITLCSYARNSAGQPSAVRTDVIEISRYLPTTQMLEPSASLR